MSFTFSIHRGENTDEGTFSSGVINGVVFNVLELPDRANQTGISRIPAGTYRTEKIMSPHFNQMVFRLLEVPGREDVEIHPANFAGDESLGWFSDLRGCITVGLGVGVLRNPEGKVQHAVTSSKLAFAKLMDMVGNSDLIIEITEG